MAAKLQRGVVVSLTQQTIQVASSNPDGTAVIKQLTGDKVEDAVKRLSIGSDIEYDKEIPTVLQVARAGTGHRTSSPSYIPRKAAK